MEDQEKRLVPAGMDQEAPVAVEPPPKKERLKPMTVGGFAENALDDVWEFAKGLYNILPATIKSYQQNLPYIIKNAKEITPSMLFRYDSEGGSKDQMIKGEFKGAIPETLKGMLEGVKEPYKKHGARVMYERPFSTTADALTLWAVGVGQIKNIGKIAQASGAGEKAERLIRAAEFLEQLPAKAARGAIDKGVYKLTGHDLAKERQFLHIKQEERGAEMLKLEDVAKKNIKAIDALNPEEQALFHRARVGGDTAYGVSDEVLAANPKVKAALEAYAPLEQYSKEVALKWNRLTPAEMDQALAKKFALEHLDDMSPANIAKAAEIIEEARKTGKRLPMYGPNVFQGKGKTFTADDLISDMMTGGKTVREGKVGAYEEMKGAKGYVKDPRIYAREMVKGTADVEAKSRMMDRILQDKALKTAPASVSSEGFNPSKSIPEGVHRKYYEDAVRSEALKTVTDPTIKRLLTWEYTGRQNAMMALYDKFYRLFAKMATRWNPKWVPGNIVGDAFLGALFGAEWDAARKYIKSRQLPAQFLATKGNYLGEDPLAKPNIVEGVLERYGDIATQMDQATRAGILTRYVSDKMKRVVADHEAFAESVEQVLTSTQRFSDVQVGLQRIEENVSRRSMTVRKRDAEITALQHREQKLDLAIAEATQKDVNKLASKTGQRVESTFQKVQDRAASQFAERQTAFQAERSAALNKATASRVQSSEFGKKAAATKANLDRVEGLYRELSLDSSLVEAEARKRLASIPESQISSEMNELLSRYPGFSRTRDPRLVREIKGKVRDTVLRKHIDEFKAEVYPQIKEGLERHILNLTGEYEKLVGRGKSAAAYQIPEIKAAPLEGITTIKAKVPQRAISPAIQKALGRRDALRQVIVNKTSERNAVVRDIMDDLIKQGELDKLVPGLREQVNIVRDGVERANAILPSFNNLNGFEQRVVGRVIPFYPFVKTMTMLAFRIPFIAPVKSFMWNRFQDFLMNLTTDPRLPEDFRGRVPLAVTEDGKTVWFKLTGYSPFEQLKTSQFGGMHIPGMLDPLRNPAIALGYKFLGGKTVYDVTSLPYGTEAVLAGDGTRVRFKNNGKLQREMNQTPLISGLMHLFPTVQLATAVLTPYWTNKFDWAGMPEPILKQDGSYKYPKEMIDRIGNLLGANIQTRSQKEVIRTERLKAMKTIQEYMKTYQKADPEERELIREAMRDYQRGLYRHFDK